MKINSLGGTVAGLLFAFGAIGCSTGKPKYRTEILRPDQQHNFAVLYQENCSACHGEDGQAGAALPLNNAVYLAWAGHDRILSIVANGVPHRLMPGFSAAGGGLLTDQQIEDIVHGMMTRWTKPGILNGANLPTYAPTSAGDATQGKAVFQVYCARCHGADGKGTPAADSATARSAAASKKDSAVGSIVDPTYLSLISDQGLRDIIVSGMPGENMPDWRGDGEGKSMTDKDVTDVVAWLVSHRVQFPGKPFPASANH